ncbi:VOC family protein [Actinomyces howellii]|uniref:Glyoxalase-like domain n=1 Tax=Actinomyces howellii TaxID=52771 RepID=A0A448HEM7_9ACTO|nr:VOC family protein [Actinomyces howellii]VEG26437.1 Glyoxalase-like domain [Actinomyces howellii]
MTASGISATSATSATSTASALRPYLNFRAETARALDFYQSIFGGEVTVLTFAQAGTLPPDHPAAALCMHAELRSDVVHLLASDAPEGVAPQELVRGNDMHLCLLSDDLETGRAWFEALSEGAEVHLPFEVQSWGDAFGMLTDRFGTRWMVNAHAGAADGGSGEPEGA